MVVGTIASPVRIRQFDHITKPITAYIRNECGGVIKTNALGTQPNVMMSFQADTVPHLVVGNEVVSVAYELDEIGGQYHLRHTPKEIIRTVEKVFTKVNYFYDHHLYRITSNFYGVGFPLKFDVFYYETGHSLTVIKPSQFRNAPFPVVAMHLQDIYVPINIVDGFDEVKAVIKSTNLLALLRNISGTVGAGVDNCLSLLD